MMCDESKGTVRSCEDAKCGTGIADVGQVEKIGDDGNGLMQMHGVHDKHFGDLIQRDQDQTHAHQQPIPTRPIIHETASTQRSHNVGCSG